MAVEKLTGGFQSLGVNLFKGLNLTVAPELIEEGEARKLLNFRMEKAGKLVTRNGYVFGLFLNLAGARRNGQFNPQNPIGPFDPTKVPNVDMWNNAHTGYVGYPLNLGIVGIGEYRLENFWNEIDTNRLMVYAIIHPEINPELTQNQNTPFINPNDNLDQRLSKYNRIRNRLEFLFAPVTGRYKDVILDPFYLFFGNQGVPYWNWYNNNQWQIGDTFFYPSTCCEISAMGLSVTPFIRKKRLLAPRRTMLGNDKLNSYINSLTQTISGTNQLIRDEFLTQFEDEITKQFLDMKQYRNWLVISDPINGDMLLEDDYDFQDDTLSQKNHFLRLRPNCLDDFDVDIVEIHLRLGAGEENDKDVGVETGMALYKFKLPTKITKKNVDVFDNTLTDGDFLDYQPSDDKVAAVREFKVIDYIVNRKSTTLVTAFARSMLGKTGNSQLNDDYRYSFLIRFNNNYRRIFTNVNEAIEFPDIFGELQYVEDEEIIKSEDDKDIIQKRKVKSANVYIWEDFKIRYYPSQYGNRWNWNKFYYLFRRLDRPYEKSYEKIPRIINLREQRDYAPINGWYYKFVWDYGNGFYSAPSRPLAVPDIMWSAVRDSELMDVDAPNDLTAYYRNYNQSGWRQNSDFGGSGWVFPRDRDLGLFSCPDDVGVYNRPDNIFHNDSTGGAPFLDQYHNLFQKRLRIFSNFNLQTINQRYVWRIGLTNYGNLLWRLKRKLYNGTKNRFGDMPGYYFNSEDPNFTFQDFVNNINNSSPTALMGVVDFVTLITCFFGGRDVGTKGLAWQYVKLNFEKWTKVSDSDIDSPSDDSLQFDFGPILIPIFQHYDVPQSRLSLFDDEGRLRLNWLAPIYYTNNNEKIKGFNKFFSLPWVLEQCPRYTGEDADPPISSFTLFRKPYYPWMNLYVFFYSDIDYNNLPESYFLPNSKPIWVGNNFANQGTSFAKAEFNDSYLHYWFRYVLRPTNCIRGVKTENSMDRMHIVGKDIPNEVKERLILRGLCELQVVSPDEVLAPWFIRQGVRLATYGDQGNYWFFENTSHNSKYFDNFSIPIQGWRSLGFFAFNVRGDYCYWRTDKRFPASDYFYTDIYTPVSFNPPSTAISSPFAGYSNEEVFSVFTMGNLMPATSVGLMINYLFPIGNYQGFTGRWYWNSDRNGILRENLRYNVGTDSIIGSDISTNSNNYLECCLTNLDITLYGEGERLIAPEQLSAIFPSSLLFKAPRVALRIPSNKVPLKAKRLLVFRTKATIDNYFNPDQYGLVKILDINRPDPNNPFYIETKTKREDGTEIIHRNEIYFFDNVTDDNLDFSDSPDNYEGLRTNIRSSFNLPLNERVYYYNFEEDYQPLSPRELMPQSVVDELPNVALATKKISTNLGYQYTAPITRTYGLAYEDVNGVISRIKRLDFLINDLSPNDFYEVVFLFAPVRYNPAVKLIVLRLNNNNQWEKIGEIKPEDNGIFVDNNRIAQRTIANDNPITMKYPTGLRWSEPYRPDWIKEDSFTEYKGGRLGTGLQENYGNLILFTENSIARYTVQALDPPISRVDEITPEVGCIAPQTILNIDNNLFFLSHKGWMHYNNNIIKNIDEKVHPELETIIYTMNRWIKYSTAGFNPAFSEFYLNLPLIPSNNYNIIIDKIFDDKDNINTSIPGFGTLLDSFFYDYGKITYHERDYPIWGNIYIQNLLLGYNTKFSYVSTLIVDDRLINTWWRRPLKIVEHPLGNTRLYFVNSIGEMKSADIVPNNYPAIFNINRTIINPVSWYWAGVYTETPTRISVLNQPLYLLWTRDRTQGWISSWVERTYIDEDVIPQPPTAFPLFTRNASLYDFSTYSDQRFSPTLFIFPIPRYTPVRWIFFSKFFSQNDESSLKRVRKTILNIYTKGNFAVNLENFHREEYDNNIEEANSPNRWLNLFYFRPTETYFDPFLQTEFTGRGQSVISVVNNIPIIPTSPLGTRPPNLNDFIAKPMKTSIEIYGRKRAQLNEIEINWRGIHQYLM
jgi:hypothetical protein